MNTAENILVIKLGALGDFVQAFGAMAAIRRHHPEASITLLTTAPFLNFAKASNYFDYVWIDERPKKSDIKGWLTLRKRLIDGRFSRVYDLQNSDRTALYLKLFTLARKPEWVGAAAGASHRNASPQRTAGTSLEGHIQTLALVGIRDIQVDDLRWIEGDVSRFALTPPYVLIVCGSSPDHPEKRWDAKRYGEIARIVYGWGFQPVIIGTLDEKEAADTIKSVFPQALDLTGQTTLFDIAVLGRHAAAAIGNDTGPMHIIAPTGCPSWVLFSKHGNPRRHAPPGAHVRTIQVDDLANLSVAKVMETMAMRDFRACKI